MLRLSFIICFTVLVSSSVVSAQDSDSWYPKIGDKPEYEFRDFSDPEKEPVKIQERKGKWLVLDFWGRYCSGCIATMPKMDKMSRVFGDSVDLFMVALCNPKAATNRTATNALFSRLADKYRFNMVTAFDSVLEKKFDISGVPAIYVINPKGELVAKAQKIDSAILSDLMAGKSPSYERHYSGHEPPPDKYNYSLPLLTSGHEVNGGVDTSASFRSVLTRRSPEMPEWHFYGFDETPSPFPGWAEAIGFSLKDLYFIAWHGMASWDKRGQSGGDSLYRTFSRKIILEISDKSAFEDVADSAGKKTRNTYAYSLKLPKDRFSYMNNRKILLDDLNRYFGYISVVEERMFKVMKLVVADEKKVRNLRTRGTPYAFKQIEGLSSDRYYIWPDSSIQISGQYDIGMSYYNMPFKKFFQYVPLNDGLNMKYNSLTTGRSASENPPVIDATGLDFRIDISFGEEFRDWEATIRRLNYYGLDIVEGEMLMKCIVIRNAK